MGFLRKQLQKTTRDVFAALDIGSSKICCAIASLNPNTKDKNDIKILGIGHHASRGIRNSVIVDMDLLEESILQTIQSAEQASRQTINDLYVNIPAVHVKSSIVEAEIDVNQQTIDESHIRKLIYLSYQNAVPDDRQIVHGLPVRFVLDDNIVLDPKGMIGKKLKLYIHLLTAPKMLLANLRNCVGRCHLTIADFIVSPYASSLSTLVEDEMELGSIVVDLGGGNTSFSVFMEGSLIHVGNIPIGSNHITSDIAKVFSTPLSQAERLKTLYGSVIASTMDDRETIMVPQLGEDKITNVLQISKSLLIQVIKARIEETFDLLKKEIDQAGFSFFLNQQIVFTGGGSLLPGLRELALLNLGKHIRISNSHHFAQEKEGTSSPIFSTCAGMLHYGFKNFTGIQSSLFKENDNRIVWNRLKSWVRENI